MERKASASTLSMVQLALFSAIILAMAFTPGLGYIPLGVTRATIIHLPVIIGGILLGPKKGAFLGGVFGPDQSDQQHHQPDGYILYLFAFLFRRKLMEPCHLLYSADPDWRRRLLRI